MFFSFICLVITGISAYAQVRRIETTPLQIAGQIPGYSEVSTINTKTISYTPSVPPTNPVPVDDDSTTEVLKVYRYADVIASPITIADGNVTSTTIGKIWTLKISIPNALNVGFVIDQFNLASNAEMYVFDESRTMLDSAVKKSQFAIGSKVGIMPFTADNAIIYIVEPGNFGALQSTIGIDNVDAGFQEFGFSGNPLARGPSVNCDPSIKCQPDRLYNARAVALMTVNGYSGTGTLLNSENVDAKPYFLTAFHVIDVNNDDFLDPGEIAALERSQFIFHYWRTSCTDVLSMEYIYFSGAILRGQDSYTDAVLLELTNAPGIGDGVNYAGWSRQSSASADYGSYIIHHPQSEDMRVTSTRQVNSWLWNSQFWSARYSEGTVDRGSSGSALFNENGQVIGQLRSGWSSCNFTDFGDRYGKIERSWNFALQSWLSPTQNLTSMQTLVISPLTITGSDYFTCPSPDIPFSVPNLIGCSYAWSHSSNLQLISGQGTATAYMRSISTLPADYGWVSVTVTDSKGISRVISATKDVQMGIPYLFPPPVFKNGNGGEGNFCSSHTGNFFEISPDRVGVTYQYRIRNYLTNAIVYTAPISYTAGSIPVAYNPPSAGWYILEIKVNSPCGSADWEGYEVEYVDCTMERQSSFDISVAPNPTSSVFHLTINDNASLKKSSVGPQLSNSQLECVLYNVQRAEITKRWLLPPGAKHELDVSGVKTGQYVLVITRGRERSSRHVIVK